MSKIGTLCLVHHVYGHATDLAWVVKHKNLDLREGGGDDLIKYYYLPNGLFRVED